MRSVSKGEALSSPPMAAAGERERRFEAVYAANHTLILGYVLRRTSNPDDAADILAVATVRSTRPERAPPGSAGALPAPGRQRGAALWSTDYTSRRISRIKSTWPSTPSFA